MIIKNLRLFFFIILLAFSFTPFLNTHAEDGYAWTQTSAASKQWRGISSSADGTTLVAVEYSISGPPFNITTPGFVTISTSSGSTWVQKTPPGSSWWVGVTMSDSGATMAAVEAQTTAVFRISTTTGNTWASPQGGVQLNWVGVRDVTSSSNGEKLAITINNGYIYTTSNGGFTWATSTSAGSRAWREIDSSSDGTKLAATVSSGYIYTSGDSGVSWTQQTSAGSRAWLPIASSGNGSKIVAGVVGGYIYISEDSGTNWATSTSAGSRNWSSIAMSDDGSIIIAAVSTGYIYISNDGGLTWTEQTSAGSRAWSSVTTSSDGTKLAATVSNGRIYTALFDDTEPELIGLDSSTASTTYALSFSTNPSATSTFTYELLSGTGTSTSVTTGSEHNFNLPQLIPCTTYRYTLRVTNSFFRSASVNSTFTTNCLANAGISSTTQQIISTSTGGTVSLNEITLTIPPAYATTSASFQITKLSSIENIVSSYGLPSAERTVINGYAYSFSALPSATTTLSTFDESLDISFTYNPNDIPPNIDPSSLIVYRNDNSVWTALNCQVNTSIYQITCQTDHFSIFGLFGSSYPPEEVSRRKLGSRRQVVAVNTDIANPKTNVQASVPDMKNNEDLKEQITRADQRNLMVGLEGADVLALQKFLNSQGFILTLSGPGSLGNETSFFGALTRSALARFQTSKGIVPAVGYFGPITRGYISK